MSEIARSQIRAIVSGRVQGVGFRYFAQRQAEKYQIVGWVRNRWNGTVEIMAVGEPQNIERFLKTIGRGPRSGTTQNVEVKSIEPEGNFTSFRIRMTN